MLFPWVGLLEQVRLADVFVHYDDAQFSKGSFVNRVQIKTPQGVRWMTAPLQNLRLGQRICEVQLASTPWADQHLELLAHSFEGAPHASDALALAESVYRMPHRHLGELARESLLALCRYFGLDRSTRFVDVQSLRIGGAGSRRVLDVVRRLGGSVYVTGHGAARYLEHELFESEQVQVAYMNYRREPYPQLHGAFTPYVSSLDLVANCGRDGLRHICSDTVSWKEFVHDPA